jgi:hypothetical protein
MGDESTRWTIVIDKQTDIDVRTRLAERGMKKGDLSRYVSDVIKRDLLMQTVREARSRFKGMSPQEIEVLIDEAVAEARSDRSAYARRP